MSSDFVEIVLRKYDNSDLRGALNAIFGLKVFP
jgi:hypothetical protein